MGSVNIYNKNHGHCVLDLGFQSHIVLDAFSPTVVQSARLSLGRSLLPRTLVLATTLLFQYSNSLASISLYFSRRALQPGALQ